MAEGGPPDCKSQKTEISNLIKSPLQKGDTWYLIDVKWFKQWKKYVGYDSWDMSNVGDQSAYPGPIDNTPLYAEGSTSVLAENLMDELDYILLPTEAWNKQLVAWYGIIPGQEPVARRVIEQGMFVKHCKVEVYLMELKLCENSDCETSHTQQFSRADTIEFLMQEMKRVFNISENKEVRLWNKYTTNTYEQLNKLENTVQDSGLYVGQTIVIEQKNEDGTWPRQTKSTSTITTGTATGLDGGSMSANRASSSSYSSYGGSSGYGSYGSLHSSDYHSTAKPGLCGLSNLGNTCFMNSALQCMSNVPELTEYFLGNHWQEELNEDNPLGMRGEIATSYAELIRTMWSGKHSYTIPKNFKIAVGRFAPQFSGYQQQDSQELMAFLLDGLHEDLNRIKKKPYVEQKDHDGRADEDVAQEAWANYRLRNDSVIVDTFHGLLKSTLVCPECSKISVTFDPFCYLSLPLPYRKERMIEVFFIPLDVNKPTTQYKLTVSKMGSVAELCTALGHYTHVPRDRMVVTDVYNHRFHKIFTPTDGLQHILDRDDIFIYEIPISANDDQDTLVLPVYLREEKQGPHNSYSQLGRHLFGQPMLVPIPRKGVTYDKLYNIIIRHMSRYVCEPDDSDIWWEEDCDQQENDQNNEDLEMEDKTGEGENKENVNDVDIKDDEGETGPAPKCRRLFTMQYVNSYGNSEFDKLQDDDKPLKLTNRTYLAVDWIPKAKEKFYDEKAAEALEVHESVNMKPVKSSKTVQLNECLDLFTTKERLGADDPWYCPQCKEHRQATKKFDLWSLPDVLVVHLKRFSYNRYWRDKLDTLVEYPTQSLSMKKWVINNNHQKSLVYDLIGVSNHFGGMGGGHYTAFAKNNMDGDWYNFDDASVSAANEDSVVAKHGYVLVYQRRGVVRAQSPPRKVRMCHANAAAGAPSSNKNGSNGTSNGSLSDDENDNMDIN